MFFSISMPVYNAEKYLNKSINSVMEQTEKDFELILVNDGSRDNSLSICYEWQKRYPEIIRVIDKENSGSLFTRRVCLKESRGNYLYIMDADDYITDKDMLKIIRKEIEVHNCDLILFNSSKDDNNVSPISNFPFSKNTILDENEKNKMYRLLLTTNWLNTLWDKVFSRELVDWEVDYTKFKDITHGTDAFQSLPICYKARRIIYLNNIFYHYTVENNSQSIVHTFKKTVYNSFKEIHKRLSVLSKSWINIENKDLLLKNGFMNSIMVFFSRTLKVKDNLELIDLYKTVGNDPYFRENYNLKGNSFSTKVIVFLLYHKRVYCLVLINRLLKLNNTLNKYSWFIKIKQVVKRILF